MGEKALLWTMIGCILLVGICAVADSSLLTADDQVHDGSTPLPDKEGPSSAGGYPCTNVLSAKCRELGLDAVLNATAFGRRELERKCKTPPKTLLELASAVGIFSSQCKTDANDGSFVCHGYVFDLVIPEKMANDPRYLTCEAVDRINLGFQNGVFGETLFESDDTQ